MKLSTRLLFLAPIVCFLPAAVFPFELYSSKASMHLPRVDFVVATGFCWIAQASSTVNLSDHFYLKARTSSLLFVNEAAALAGIQLLRNARDRVQFGAGFSRLSVDRTLPRVYDGGESRHGPLTAMALEANMIHYTSIERVRFGLFLGPNVTILQGHAISSLNLGLVVGAL